MAHQVSKDTREMAIGHAAMLFLCNIENWQQGFEQYEILAACDQYEFDYPDSVLVADAHSDSMPYQIAEEIESASDVFVSFSRAVFADCAK